MLSKLDQNVVPNDIQDAKSTFKKDFATSLRELSPMSNKEKDIINLDGNEESASTPFDHRYLNKLDLAYRKRILNLGCGNGAIARSVARRGEFSGKIVGVDSEDTLIDAAHHITSAEGLSRHIEFRVDDTQAIADVDESYDAVIIHMLLSHVADPEYVIWEAARVLVPGGVIAIFDADYASLTYGAGDRDYNSAIVDRLLNVVCNNPNVMHHLPSLLKQSELEVIDFTPEVHVEMGVGCSFIESAQRYVPMAVTSGSLSVDAGAMWLSVQRAASDHGTFFGSCNYYTYLARKPSCKESGISLLSRATPPLSGSPDTNPRRRTWT
jgi:2-polyprenyl-3-methyl-5-hydroxy-6-metoxy-1,4-benzoquinol methylase